MRGFEAVGVTGHWCSRERDSKPMADQVMTMEPELHLCVFVECCSHLTNIQNFWLLW